MRPRVILFCILVDVLFLSFTPAAGLGSECGHERSFGLKGWFTSGDAGWQISFPYSDYDSGGNGSGRIESELRFRNINSPVTIFHVCGSLNPEWGIHASFGLGSISNGRGTDTDRDYPEAGGMIVFSESTQDISGDVSLYSIDFTYRKRYADNNRSPWGVILGFLHYEDRLVITNGVQTISEPGWWWEPYSNPPLGPFYGLRSTYDFSWDAFKIGAMYEHKERNGISLSGSFSVYPILHYQGYGNWNLRDMTFTHRATEGIGYEAAFGMKYPITDTAEFSAGYRYLHLKAENGTDDVYIYGIYIGAADLDFAEVTRQGAYAGFLFRF